MISFVIKETNIDLMRIRMKEVQLEQVQESSPEQVQEFAAQLQKRLRIVQLGNPHKDWVFKPMYDYDDEIALRRVKRNEELEELSQLRSEVIIELLDKGHNYDANKQTRQACLQLWGQDFTFIERNISESNTPLPFKI